ncbi:MAG: hypothetical protein Tsb0020_23440 [Haliangiales bacterium]
MRETILELLSAWMQAYHSVPVYTALIGVGVGLAGLLSLSRAAVRGIERRAPIAGRPVLLVAAAIVLALCLLWTAIDAVLWWRQLPLLGERIVWQLVPPELRQLTSLQEVLGLEPGATRLVLPGAITMPIGLLVAGAVYRLLTWFLSSTLLEMITLQRRPDDVLQREAEAALAQAEAALAQAEEAPEGQATSAPGQAKSRHGDRAGPTQAGATRPPSPSTTRPGAATDDSADAARSARSAPPLADDQLGYTYKLLGHWSSLQYAEERFVRWYRPRATSLAALVVAGAGPAALGHLPVAAWVGMGVLAVALRLKANVEPARLAQDAQAPATSGAAGADADPPEAETDRADQINPDDDGVDVGAGAGAGAEPLTRQPLRHDSVIGPQLVPITVSAQSDRDRHRRAVGQAVASPVMREILAALGVTHLYDHQDRAASAFTQARSVLLATPRGSGRSLLCDALVLQSILVDAQNVLYVVPDAAAAEQAWARFQARTRAAHWHWNLAAIDLSNAGAIADAQRSTPSLVFADPSAIERELCARSARWAGFLAAQTVLVIPDIDRYAGARGAHVAQLLRRVERVKSRLAHGPQRLLWDQPDPQPGAAAVRALATAEPGWADIGGFAQRLTGRSLTLIGAEHDHTPRPAQEMFFVRTDQPGSMPSGPEGALALARVARERDFAVAFSGYDASVTTSERGPEVALEDAEVVIHRLALSSCTSLAATTRHLGQRAAGPLPVQVLYHPERNPLLEAIAQGAPVWQPKRGPALICHPDADHIARYHARATMADGEIPRAGLARAFSGAVTDRVTDALRTAGALRERTRRWLDRERGAVRSVVTVQALDSARLGPSSDTLGQSSDRDADSSSQLALHVAGAPLPLVEQASRALVTTLEAARGLTAAYPGRVIVSGGERYTVLDAAAQEVARGRPALCAAGGISGSTVPLCRFDIHLLERRERGERRADPRPADERRRHGVRRLGGAPFTFQHRDADITESVHGLRRLDGRGDVIDTSVYERPLRSRFVGRVAVLGFLDNHPTPDTLHGLVHGALSVLPALISYDDDDLNVVSLPDSNAIGFVDLHPGGAGFADAIDLDVVRDIFAASLAMARACGCQSGCPRCIHLPTCRASTHELQQVDKAGLQALLSALLP